MKKWTKAERERASREGKARWAARKLRDTRQFQIIAGTAQGGGGGSRSGAAGDGVQLRSIDHPTVAEGLATDIVRLIAHDVPADVIVKVVERILRP